MLTTFRGVGITKVRRTSRFLGRVESKVLCSTHLAAVFLRLLKVGSPHPACCASLAFIKKAEASVNLCY